MDAISCLQAPPPPPLPALLLPTSSYYTASDAAAMARPLHFSTTTGTGTGTGTTTTSADSSVSGSSSSSSLSHHHHSHLLAADLPSLGPYYAPLPPHAAATCCDSVLVADSPPRRRRTSPPGRTAAHVHALAPAGARVGKGKTLTTKRRSRASKRAPTTYISTDPANFRLMVQQITGAQPDMTTTGDDGVDMTTTTMLQQATAAALLGAAGCGGYDTQLRLPAGGDEASAAALRHQHQLQLQLQQQPCFPTLDSSWNVMFDTNSADLL